MKMENKKQREEWERLLAHGQAVQSDLPDHMRELLRQLDESLGAKKPDKDPSD
jgi:hypothetical protein